MGRRQGRWTNSEEGQGKGGGKGGGGGEEDWAGRRRERNLAHWIPTGTY